MNEQTITNPLLTVDDPDFDAKIIKALDSRKHISKKEQIDILKSRKSTWSAVFFALGPIVFFISMLTMKSLYGEELEESIKLFHVLCFTLISLISILISCSFVFIIPWFEKKQNMLLQQEIDEKYELEKMQCEMQGKPVPPKIRLI